MKKKNKDNPIDLCISLLKQGYNDEYIKNCLAESFDRGTDPQKTLNEAKSILSNQHDTRLQHVWNLHRRRYSKEICRLLDTQDTEDQNIEKPVTYKVWLAARNKKIKAYLRALDSLRQLENLMLLTDNSVMIDINEKIQINSQVKKPKYNFTKLTFEEQVELYEIMLATKDSLNGLQLVKQAILSPISEAIDISYAIEEEPNISQIKHEIGAVPEDNTKPVDPSIKLRDTLARIAAQKFKDAGANLDKQEQQYLIDRN